jgi:hypothetical protein
MSFLMIQHYGSHLLKTPNKNWDSMTTKEQANALRKITNTENNKGDKMELEQYIRENREEVDSYIEADPSTQISYACVDELITSLFWEIDDEDMRNCIMDPLREEVIRLKSITNKNIMDDINNCEL